MSNDKPSADELSRASGVLYSLAKQGTHRRAVSEILAERGLEEESISGLFERYTRNERRACTHAITSGVALLVLSIGLTVVTLSSLVETRFARFWPWGFLVGAWLLGSGLRRRAKLRKFNRT
ncbi:MAG: hypothetical protein JXR37_23115 [Kiritimatiellae bacterium]|nr:hypothetical protein [Kiritimatiellia bacterium]